MTHHSIIFDLDLDLKLLDCLFVNSESGLELVSVETLEEVWREDKSLNLSQLFEPLWVKHYISHLQNAREFFLLIGPQAGFSDSRVVYMWLKSQEMFECKPFFVYKLGAALDLQTQDKLLTADLLDSARKLNNKNLTYSKEPRIGKR